MRKIPIALIGLATCLSNIYLAGADTFAIYQEPNATWWTVQELLEFKEQVEQEEAQFCGNDVSCKEELFFSHFESEDTRYQALDIMLQSRFVVTSIDSNQEKIKVIYFDEEPILKRMGIEEHDPLKHIFIAWFDQDNPAITNYSYQYPYESQFPDDIHLVYIGNNDTGFPANQEFELPVQKTNLSNNHLGSLKLAVFADRFNAMGQANYLSCLREPDYAGECRIMYSAEQGSRYFPPRETLTTGTPVTQTDITLDDSNENSSQEDTAAIEEKSEKKKSTKISKNPVTTSASSIKVPETGMNTKAEEGSIEFPWWLVGLIILGNVTLLWLFWPTPTKHRKNLKKTLDKKLKAR